MSYLSSTDSSLNTSKLYCVCILIFGNGNRYSRVKEAGFMAFLDRCEHNSQLKPQKLIAACACLCETMWSEQNLHRNDVFMTERAPQLNSAS